MELAVLLASKILAGHLITEQLTKKEIWIDRNDLLPYFLDCSLENLGRLDTDPDITIKITVEYNTK